MPAAFWQLRQMCSPSPNALAWLVMFQRFCSHRRWSFCPRPPSFRSECSSGYLNQRQVDGSKYKERFSKRRTCFIMPPLHFGFEVNAVFTPFFSPIAVRLCRYLDTTEYIFSPSVALQSLHHLHYSCPFADPIRWPLARMRFYFYFLSEPCSFFSLGLTFPRWTPY